LTKYEIIVGKLHIYRRNDLFYHRVRDTTFNGSQTIWIK